MNDLKLPLSFKVQGNDNDFIANFPHAAQGLINDKRKEIALIITSAIYIETKLKEIISSTLFSEIREEKGFVEGLILDSEWCTFSVKRKLIKQILKRKKILNGKQLNELEKSLRKVEKYRNIFAHGEIFYSHYEIVISYFDELPKEQILDEIFFAEIKQHFVNSDMLLSNLAKMIKK